MASEVITPSLIKITPKLGRGVQPEGEKCIQTINIKVTISII